MPKIKKNADKNKEKIIIFCDDTIDFGKEPLPLDTEELRQAHEECMKMLKEFK